MTQPHVVIRPIHIAIHFGDGSFCVLRRTQQLAIHVMEGLVCVLVEDEGKVAARDGFHELEGVVPARR